MSGRERWGRVPESVLADGRLSARDLRVYCALAVHADKHGRCWPKRERIAEMTGIALPNITLATNRLRELGHIEKVGKGGHSRPTQYVLSAFKKGISTDTVSDPKRVSDGTTVNGISTDTVSGQKGIATDTRNEQPANQNPEHTPEQDLQDYALLLEVVELYHQTLPQLPPLEVPTAAIERDFSELIRKHPEAAEADWWRKFFEKIGKQCPYLLGKRTRFMANFGWLVKYDNMAKVINGDYLDSDAGQQSGAARQRRKSLEEQMDVPEYMRGGT